MLYIWKKFISNELREVAGKIDSLAKKNDLNITAKVSSEAGLVKIELVRQHPIFHKMTKQLEVTAYDTQRAQVSWQGSDGTSLSVFAAYEVEELAKTAIAIMVNDPLTV